MQINKTKKKKYRKANDKNTIIKKKKHTPDIVLQKTRNWGWILLLNTNLRLNNIQSLFDKPD